jgi:CRP/FNR family cyclic AMP-dependent transcriptional regulator
MSDAKCSILGSVLGKDLSDDECQVFKEFGTVRDLQDNEMLIEEGKVDNSLHVVIEGNLAGALGFIDGQEHSATLRAVGPARVFSVERARFESLLDSHPHLVYGVMRAIIRGVHTTLRRMNMQHLELTNYIAHQHGRY